MYVHFAWKGHPRNDLYCRLLRLGGTPNPSHLLILELSRLYRTIDISVLLCPTCECSVVLPRKLTVNLVINDFEILVIKK